MHDVCVSVPSKTAEPGKLYALHCYLFNARSLVNKLPEVHELLYHQRTDIDIFCVTESWLSDDISDGMLDPKSLFTILRSDRKTRGGGVCIFIRNCLAIQVVDSLQLPSGVETMCFDLLWTKQRYRVSVVYSPPSSSVARNSSLLPSESMAHLCEWLESNISSWGPSVIMGDFNCPGINWDIPSCPNDPAQKPLYDFITYNGFRQYVIDPTRLTNTLDLVFTNDPFIVSSVDTGPSFSTADHCSVSIELLVSASTDLRHEPTPRQKKYIWKQGDYVGMSSFLSNYDWDKLFTFNLTVNDLWSAFRGVLDYAIDCYVPHVVEASRGTSNLYGHNYPRHIKKLINRKRCIWRQHRKFPEDEKLSASYSSVCAECKDAMKRFEQYVENSIINSKDTGAFYKYVNKKIGRVPQIGVLKDSYGKSVTEDVDKANLLNNYFNSVYTKDDGISPPFAKRSYNGAGLDNIMFQPASVTKCCKTLLGKLSSGPDGYRRSC